jgi:CheY-like chemotaxis protein
MSRILIADDQNDVLEALRILLKGEGQQTDAMTSLAGIFQALQLGAGSTNRTSGSTRPSALPGREYAFAADGDLSGGVGACLRS